MQNNVEKIYLCGSRRKDMLLAYWAVMILAAMVTDGLIQIWVMDIIIVSVMVTMILIVDEELRTLSVLRVISIAIMLQFLEHILYSIAHEYYLLHQKRVQMETGVSQVVDPVKEKTEIYFIFGMKILFIAMNIIASTVTASDY